MGIIHTYIILTCWTKVGAGDDHVSGCCSAVAVGQQEKVSFCSDTTDDCYKRQSSWTQKSTFLGGKYNCCCCQCALKGISEHRRTNAELVYRSHCQTLWSQTCWEPGGGPGWSEPPETSRGFIQRHHLYTRRRRCLGLTIRHNKHCSNSICIYCSLSLFSFYFLISLRPQTRAFWV